MKTDNYGLLYMEQNLPDVYAATADSCAETGRYLILRKFTGSTDALFTVLPLKYSINTENLPRGVYVRHPLHTEDDFGPDQWLPRQLAVGSMVRMPFSFMCLASKYLFLAPAALYLQELVFRLPFRWDDSTQKFASSKGSTADYLNWFMLVCISGYKPKLVTKDEMLSAVADYYKPETTNFNLLYAKAADKVWGAK